MASLCEGRVVVVTGGGRGLGRAHSLALAAHGARVVVNDLGGQLDGAGASTGPAQAVVEEIQGAGGEAVAGADDCADWEGRAGSCSWPSTPSGAWTWWWPTPASCATGCSST